MAKIVLASHGPLAKAIKESAHMICGDTESVEALCLFEDDDANEFRDQLEKLVTGVEETLLIVDFPGGTPAIKGLTLLQNHSNLRLISGMNAMMVIESIMMNDHMPLDDLIETVLNTAKLSIKELVYEAVEYDIDDL